MDSIVEHNKIFNLEHQLALISYWLSKKLLSYQQVGATEGADSD